MHEKRRIFLEKLQSNQIGKGLSCSLASKVMAKIENSEYIFSGWNQNAINICFHKYEMKTPENESHLIATT